MIRRKSIIGLVCLAVCAGGLGVVVLPAAAQLRTLTVTLVGGQTVQVTVDVPPGTPLDQIKLPGFSAPVVSVTEANPPAAPSPATPDKPKAGADPAPQQKDTAPRPKSDGGTPAQPTTPGDKKGTARDPGARKSDKAGRKGGSGRKGTSGAPSRASGGGTRASDPRGATKPRPVSGSGGQPTAANPTLSVAQPGPAAIGVPNFFIDKFRIPPFLLSIYQAAGTQYGIPWQVLAGINEIETDYGRNLSVSSAGALGWMQFIPSTFKQYGVDANADGRKDPYNPVDAIFSAARYLKAAGGDKNIKKGIFAYNHADWYVQSVLLRAKLIGGLPPELVGSLTGLTQGHFPVHADARYADSLDTKKAGKKVKKGQNAALPVDSSTKRRSIDIFAAKDSPAIAVQDGVIRKVGTSKAKGRYVVLQDTYGNRYTYSQLGSVAQRYPAPKPVKVSPGQIKQELKLPRDPKPDAPASAGRQQASRPAQVGARPAKGAAKARPTPAPPAAKTITVVKERLFAHPRRPAAIKAGANRQVLESGSASSSTPGFTSFKSYFTEVFGLKRNDVVLKQLKPGAKIVAGTILGRLGATPGKAPHVTFEIQPAGKGAPKVDPKPILDGWKLLESTSIYRAAGKNPFFGPDAKDPSIGQLLLLSKEAIGRRVLADPRVDIYACGRRDIAAGDIDRRVLATLEFLASSGLKPTVTSLKCGHGFLTASGNVSEHSSGDAVDVAAVNGVPIIGHQGKGSITEMAIRKLLTLQGTMKPHQIISLMKFAGADNTLSLPDHNDHIHIGFQPLYGAGPNGKANPSLEASIKPGQWSKLIDHLGQIPNPVVRTKPSRFSIPAAPPGRASAAHPGE